MGFRVTQDEYDLIMERMNEIGFPSTRSYLLKMALNGYIFNLDLADVAAAAHCEQQSEPDCETERMRPGAFTSPT